MIKIRAVAVVTVAALAVAVTACSDKQNKQAAPQAPPSKSSLYAGAEKMASCMRGLGWQITIDADGGWEPTGGIPVAQEEQFNRDTDSCKAKFGFDKTPPPLTQAQAEAHYDALVATGECVKKLGYDVPKPPSKQKSVESMISKGDPLWDPYENVFAPGRSKAEIDKVFIACPQP
jgi:hypothetical protein